MAKRRPRLSLARVLGGTLLDAGRLSPLILALSAALIVLPAYLFSKMRFLGSSPFAPFGFLGAEVAASSLMQAFLLRLTRDGFAGWTDALRVAVRALPLVLALNVLALLLMWRRGWASAS